MGSAGSMSQNLEEYLDNMPLILDSDERDRYTIRATKRYKEAFSLDHIVGSYVKIYEEIMS